VIDKRPVSRRPRALASAVYRGCPTKNGTQVTLCAYPLGTRSTRREYARPALTPGSLVLIAETYRYLRYRIEYRGAWVLEIREKSSDRSLAERVLPTREAAMDQFDDTRSRVKTTALADISEILTQKPAPPSKRRR
jgi:hypothetical protein